MQKITLKAEKREVSGRKVKSLRRQGILPAVIYGHDFKSMPIQMPVKDFEKTYAEAGESTVVYLDVGGESHPTIIQDVALDSVKDSFLHADFYKVRLDEKIKAKIQLTFISESPAVENLGGILVKNISEIEVEGLPQDLPHEFEVDLSKLAEIGNQILVKDLLVSSKLKIHADQDAIVALIQEPISEEEFKAQMETPITTPEEVEIIKKEKKEEEGAEEAPTPSQGGAPASEPEKK
jgi:large subunit ribosomal protein L25